VKVPEPNSFAHDSDSLHLLQASIGDLNRFAAQYLIAVRFGVYFLV